MNILYIPGCYYLSNKIFLSIAKKAQKHTNIYFDAKDGFNTCNSDAEEIIKTFDRIFIRNKRKPMSLKTVFAFQDYRKELYEQLKHFEPDIIITTTDMGGLVNRMCNNWTEKNNVPYVIMQPAFLSVLPQDLKHRVKNKTGYLLANKLLDIPLCQKQEMYGCEKKSNYLFLWGKDFKKMYKGTCIEKNIHLVGNPVFDNMQSKILDMRDASPTALLCPCMFKGILSKENDVKIQKMYRDIIKQNPHVHFIVKVHPRETVEQYAKLLKNCGKNYHITKHADLYTLFRFADVQISLASYSSFEAIVAGVPVILLGNHMLEFSFDQFNHKAIFSVDGIEEFNWALDLCLSKSYTKKFKKLRINYLSTKLKYLGSSAEHIVNEIEAIVE